MINERFLFVGQGVSGGGMIRAFFYKFGNRFDGWGDRSAHRTLQYLRKREPDAPSFTFVRNPFDWYISRWQAECTYHKWRGFFEDWLFGRGGVGFSVSATHRHFTDPGCDYTGRFENIQADFLWILQQVEIVPQFVSEEEYAESFEKVGCLHVNRLWIEGCEQWLRPLFTPRMRVHVEKEDAEFLAKYGYHFDDYYYHPGGAGPSNHLGVAKVGWEEEKHLANWVSFGPRPSVKCT